jgi:solute carrier family 36 (proton-coupled amino acid transporter)
MILGFFLTVGYCFIDLPPFSSRDYFGKLETLPLFFGTVLFTFEGIALVLPLQNSMKYPDSFSKKFGVLNVGSVMITAIYIIIGTFGYWQYGEKTQGSLTLNLPTNNM